MKKFVKSILALSLATILFVCAFAGCAPILRGTYTSSGMIEQSFTFKEDKVVTISAFGINTDGTYRIEDGKIIITYKLLNLSYDMEKSFEKKGDTLIIDGTEFVKQK